MKASIALLLLLSSLPVFAGLCQYTWDRATEYTDDSPLPIEEIAHYEIWVNGGQQLGMFPPNTAEGYGWFQFSACPSCEQLCIKTVATNGLASACSNCAHPPHPVGVCQ